MNPGVRADRDGESTTLPVSLLGGKSEWEFSAKYCTVPAGSVLEPRLQNPGYVVTSILIGDCEFSSLKVLSSEI
jgi:hypothetical protein